MYSQELREGDVKKLTTVTSTKESIGIPSAKGWGWVG